jgi:hypothetical protein
VASPLIEFGGSGLVVTHPEAVRTFVQRTVLSMTYADSRFKSGTAGITGLPVGTKVEPGQAVIWRPNPIAKDGKEALLSWTMPVEGIVHGAPAIQITRNGDVTVSVEMLALATSALCEKFRDVIKGTGNGGFDRNIRITRCNDGKVIFDPNASLRDAEGNYLVAEMAYGSEEMKTMMGAMSLVAKEARYSNGNWENEQELLELLESERVLVDIYIWGLEVTCYKLLLKMYGSHPDFSFNDSERMVTHHSAKAWCGECVHIVEVPMTATFCGKTGLYFEQVESLRTKLPPLAAMLDEMSTSNHDMIVKILDTVADGGCQGKAWVTIDTVVRRQEGKCSMIIKSHPVYGFQWISELTLPAYVNTKVFVALQKSLESQGYNAMGFFAEGQRSDYFCRLNLEMFAKVQGTNSTVGYHKVTGIFGLLFVDDNGNRMGSYERDYIRHVSALQGILEKMVTDSSKLFAKATKTGDVAITMRARASAFLGREDFVVSKKTAEYLGLEAGNWAIIGRVPLPGCGVLKVIIDDNCPDWVAVINPLVKHIIEEGDVDGDQLIAIIVDSEGNIKVPKATVQSVTVVNN